MEETKKEFKLLLWSLLPLLKLRLPINSCTVQTKPLWGNLMMSQLGRWTMAARRQRSRYHLVRLEEHRGCVLLTCQWSLPAMPVNAHWDASSDLFSELLQTVWRGLSGCICLCHDSQKFRPRVHGVNYYLDWGWILDGLFVYLTKIWSDAVKGGAKVLYVVRVHSPSNEVL